jgi:hypothetical protein
LSDPDARAVRERLREFYFTNEPPRASSASGLARRLGIPRPTITGWLGGHPKVPDLPHIVTMAALDRLSPTWLLLGRGPLLLDVPTPGSEGDGQREVSEIFRESIVAELRSHMQAAPETLEQLLPPASELWREVVEDQMARVRQRVRQRHGDLRRVIVLLTEAQPRGSAVQRVIDQLRVEAKQSPRTRAALKKQVGSAFRKVGLGGPVAATRAVGGRWEGQTRDTPTSR